MIKAKLTPWQELDGKILVLTPRLNSVHELNETASWIWKNLGSGKDVQTMAQELAEEYDVNQDIAENDIRQILNEMKEKGLLLEQ